MRGQGVVQSANSKRLFFDNHGNPTSTDLSEEEIQEFAFLVWRSTLIVISMITMAYYDYIVTLPEEINTLWRRKKSLTSIVLLINRYALLLLASSLLVFLVPVSGNPLLDSRCATASAVGSIAMLILLTSGVVFDSIRIYAIMEHSILTGLGTGILGITWVALYILIPDQKSLVAVFTNGSHLGCQGDISINVSNRHAITSWTYAKDSANIAFETLVLGITLYKTLGLRRATIAAGLRTSLNGLLLQGGSLQFGLILLVSFLDIIFITTEGQPITTIVIKSIITSHLAFHLRQVYPEPEDTLRSVPSLSLRFNSRIIGNAGAPLHSLLSDGHDEIEAERSTVQYSNNPMTTIVPQARPNNTIQLADQDEERVDEAKGLLLHEEERV